MNYTISYKNPQKHFLDIKFELDLFNVEKTNIKLPIWRPGRYEVGNFAKNIKDMSVINEYGNALRFEKTDKSSWEIDTLGCKKIVIKYKYYAADLNAGSTYLNTNQLYVNPVNCCIYCPENLYEKCYLTLELPLEYRIAIGLKHIDNRNFVATNFHELVDSPFIASDTLLYRSFNIEGSIFHLWFQGDCDPNWERIISDFSKFIQEQFNMMGSFPFENYHFLFQILPYKFYHGVEHLTSTVIALGPNYDLNKSILYNELLGVSSHEIFHAWNIKSIRPIEMFPYDYSKENYSRLGYVAEGVTTYYGDLFLFRSRVFDEKSYFKTFNEQLQKHFDNFGRFSLSVADSSFDTWLDGYEKGIPNRKVSIYTEGCLIAFICDILLRRNTNNSKSLDDVMKMLYVDFAQKDRGYSENDYKQILENIGQISFDDIFNNLIWGTSSYEPYIKESLEFLGLELCIVASDKIHEARFGFKYNENDGTINAIYPNSPADIGGLWNEYRLISINNIDVSKNPSTISDIFSELNPKVVVILAEYQKKLVNLTLLSDHAIYYKKYSIQKMKHTNKEQLINFNCWGKQNLIF